MQRDRAFGIATLALSAAYYWGAGAIQQSQLADAIGPQGLPRIYAVLLALLSLVLIVRSFGRSRSDASPEQTAASAHDVRGRVLGRVAGMLGIGVVYILVAPWLGYLLAIAGVILATTYYQGGTVSRQVAIVALCGGIFFWLLFVVLMRIPQPPGWFPPSL